jgi:hypothetical protein
MNLNSLTFSIHTCDRFQILECFDTHCFTEEYQTNKMLEINLRIWCHIEWLFVTYIFEEPDASIFRTVKEEMVTLYKGGGN